jgi:two-component system cell cycle sensor histidine kinase/response regulator CckA
MTAVAHPGLDAVATVGLDGTFHAWNAAAARLVARAGGDPARANLLDLVEPSRRDAARRALAIADEGRRIGPFRVSLPVMDPLGDGLDLGVVLAPASETGQGRRGVVVTARDITPSRRLMRRHAAMRAELVGARRSAVLGRLVESVAHDLGNIMTAINGYAAIVASDLSGPQLADQLELMQAAERGTELTRSLLARTRQRAGGHVDVPIDDVVGACARMLRRLLPPRLDLVLRLTSDALVAIDPMELDQVLMNLVLNARDAMNGVGQITVETSRVGGPLAPGASGPAGVLLSVSDTGPGMDPATRERIYERYFTTKIHGSGTGLGLATVREIVDRAGGTIDVQTAPGTGTRFRINLAAAR